MSLRFPLLFVGLLTMCAASPAAAQGPDETTTGPSPAFSSDRPGFASTTATAAVGRLTTELGVLATLDTPQVLTLPNASLRVGVLEWAELRLRGMNALWSFPDGGDSSFGLGDITAGAKLGGAALDWLNVATIIEIRLPTATGDFGFPEAVPSVELVADFLVTPWFAITVNGIAAVLALEDEVLMETVRFAAGSASIKLLFTPIPDLSVYAQSFVVGDERSNSFVAVGVGASYMLLPNLQIDASFDTRVTDRGLPPTVGIGTTVLFGGS